MIRVMHTFSMILCTTTLAAAAIRQGANPVAPTPLEGAWEPESIQRESLTYPPETFAGMRFTFKGNVLIMEKFPSPRGAQCSITVETRPDPKHLDCLEESGRKTAMSWRRDGERLILAVPNGATPTERPKTLTSEKGSGTLLLTLRRAKG